MRRLILLVAGVLLSVMALGSDSPKDNADKTTIDPLEGTWRLAEFEFNGKTRIPTVDWVDTYRNGVKTRIVADGDTWWENYRIDPFEKPSHLDHLRGSMTIKSICQIDGDTLRIASFSLAYLGKDDRRPLWFNDECVIVEIYKRVK